MSWRLPGGGPSDRRIARTDISARRELRRVLFGKEEGSHRLVRPFLLFCGKKGIRTPETLLGFTRFPGGPVQPLLHLSGFEGKNRQTFPILQMPPPFFRRGGAAAEGIVRIGRCRLRADAKKARTGRACGADAPEGSELESERHGHGVLHVIGAVDVARVRTRERAVRCDLVGIIE